MSGVSDYVQKIVYTRLTTVLSGVASVYDAVPGLPDGQPYANFPYVTIGDDTSVSWDTDDQLGEDVTPMFHIWSRTKGKTETKTIMRLIYDGLHRQAAALNTISTGLSLPIRVVDSLHEFSQIFEAGDSVTRHGICRYRFKVEKE